MSLSEHFYGIVVVLIRLFLCPDINYGVNLPILDGHGKVIQLFSEGYIDLFPGCCCPLQPTIVQR